MTSQLVFGSDFVKYMGEEPKLSYVVLNKANFEKFARELLLIKQYRIEVYVKANQEKNNDWLVEYKASPGNLSQFEDILFNSEENVGNCVINIMIMAIKLPSTNVSDDNI